MTVLVIDYHMGNLGSVKRSLEECGAEVLVSDDPKDLKQAERFVLPGVGAFKDGMKNLEKHGWAPKIKAAVEDGIPMLGICLGMQVLGERGYEGGETEGLGIIPGEVKRLVPEDPGTRIPHVGWNEVYPTLRSELFEAVPPGTDFYFVHSYQFIPQISESVIATTPYCGSFASAVGMNRIWGVQFHPEKSGKPGFQILRNFLKI